MANQGPNSGVIIPLVKMGVRIIPVLSHFIAGFNKAKAFTANWIAEAWTEGLLTND